VHTYRRGGRFFGPRVNCEHVPQLPAGVVRLVLNDPRKIPYLLVWKSERDGEIKEAVRVVDLGPTLYLSDADSIEVKRTEGSVTHLRVLMRPLPRNSGYDTLLACPICCSLRRALYGWVAGGQFTNSAQRSSWQCRTCAGLRYTSEGTYIPRQFRFLGGYPRPEPWYPYVFSSPADAVAAGFCTLQS
jgi:hypothetical protein